MDKILVETIYFGLVISFLSYWIAVQIRKKLPFPIFNPQWCYWYCNFSCI